MDSTLKKKINKVHKTIDLSDIDYTPHRKGSNDSIGSQRSYDSQHSSDSHSSPTVREINKEVTALRKQDWSSTSTKSETDSECGITLSAPPIVGEKYTTYEDFTDDISNKRNSEQSIKYRSTYKQHGRYLENVRTLHDGLLSLAPIRRQTKDNKDWRNEITNRDAEYYLGYDKTPNKAEEILGKPKVPIRNARKPKQKRNYVRSLGEEVTDSVLDKTLLGTIDESHSDPKQIAAKMDEIINDHLQIPNEADWNKKTLTPKRQRSGVAPLDLKRRNSDPATTVPKVGEHTLERNFYEFQKHGMFSFAGHRFRKIGTVNKGILCKICNHDVDEFKMPGFKCIECKTPFHTKCIQNKSVMSMPCEFRQQTTNNDNKSGRRKHRKHSRTPYDIKKQDVQSKFNLTGTSEFTDRADQIISSTTELISMQDFITNKILKIESEAGEKPSDVDSVFKQALREFKDNLVQFSANKNGIEVYSIKYKDLITNFMQAMETVCQREQKDNDFPVTMGVNAFRGFMDEFMTSRIEAEKPSKTKRKKEKKRKSDDTIKYLGHTFLLTIINIPTACEICSSFFMWPIERGLVCQSCKLTCHKKCYMKVAPCLKDGNLAGDRGDTHRLFGVPLTALIEDCNIPYTIERLLATIEMNGLYTEGLYRKSGVSSKVKELKGKMEENPDEVKFEDYQVHVLASVLKSFLRDMPEPLLTFECYENFITAANMLETQDRVATLYDILRKLPKPNYDLIERLIFHLARVAYHEETNRMSAASLAIVFAPCILRTNKVLPAQDSLQDIASQTQCIETIINEQIRKMRATLDDIDTLDTARQAATKRLSSLRSSKVFSPEEFAPTNQSVQQTVEDEETILVDHIQEIQKEKELLTSTLPTLTHATSDDDMLSTDGDGSLDDISYVGEQKKPKGPIVRSVSGGDTRQSAPSKLKRQSSSDVSVKVVDECEDAPIMV